MESDCLLLGEVLNFQHLSNLPKLLNVDGEVPCHVFYAGGLKVLLRFFAQDAATRYLKNEHAWNRWFKWLKYDIIDELPFERIAWVKVIGLPIHLRSEENVRLVVGRLGKIIEVDGCQNWHNVDLTSSHARILTGDKLLINKEINCFFNGKNYIVGVVECEDIWQPFSKYYESDSEPSTEIAENDDEIEKSDSDDDGISETWENVNHMDVEEGEIVMDDMVNDNPDAAGGVVASPSPTISDGVAYVENQNVALNSESNKSPRDNNIINTENSKELSNTNNINGTGGNLVDQSTRNHGRRPTSPVGYDTNSIAQSPSGPSTLIPVQGANFPSCKFGGSLSKKRKLDKTERYDQSCSLPVRRLLPDFLDLPLPRLDRSPYLQLSTLPPST